MRTSRPNAELKTAGTKRSRADSRPDHSASIDLIRRSARPRVAHTSEADSVAFASAAERALVHSVSTDVFIATAGTRLVTVDDDAALRSLLDECATDADQRMSIASAAAEARLSDSSASIFGLVQALAEEVRACDLAPRHATRLALEAVLAHDVPHAKELAATVQGLAAGDGTAGNGREIVASILALLGRAELGHLNLNVLSALVFSDALDAAALVGWLDRRPPSAAASASAGSEPPAPLNFAPPAPLNFAPPASGCQGSIDGRIDGRIEGRIHLQGSMEGRSLQPLLEWICQLQKEEAAEEEAPRAHAREEDARADAREDGREEAQRADAREDRATAGPPGDLAIASTTPPAAEAARKSGGGGGGGRRGRPCGGRVDALWRPLVVTEPPHADQDAHGADDDGVMAAGDAARKDAVAPSWAPSLVQPVLVAEVGPSRAGVAVLDGLVSDALRAEVSSHELP